MCGSDAFIPPALSRGIPAHLAPRACCSRANTAVQARQPTAFLPPTAFSRGGLARSLALAEQARPWWSCRRVGQGLFATAGGEGGHPEGGVRVNKCFKEFASRRESDRLVADGRVTVNGRVADMGEVRRAPILCSSSCLGCRMFVYLKYWKPVGVVCTTDRSIRDNIIDAVGYPERVFTVGRLDKDSSGLILLTSDGRLPNAVLRSGQRHDKRYIVQAHMDVTDQDMRELADGVPLTAPTLPCEFGFGQVTRLNRDTLSIVLQEGRNRQIRKMMEVLGFRVRELQREEVMGIDLRGLRGPGAWSILDNREMGLVKEALRRDQL
ncbi:pseudouridine synthase [Baffinella frigidus]|nr:pseudouridine synthase [Cryptophyta sp. CCMP2293]